MREKHQLVQLLALVQLLNPKCIYNTIVYSDISDPLSDPRTRLLLLIFEQVLVSLTSIEPKFHRENHNRFDI
jgi:hypothetical protein